MSSWSIGWPRAVPNILLTWNAPRAATATSARLRQRCSSSSRIQSPAFDPWLSQRRGIQTATAYKPYTLPDPSSTSPPRNADTPETSITMPAHPKSAEQQSEPVKNQVRSSVTDPPRRKSRLRPRKAAMTLSPAAVIQLRNMLDGPSPQLIRVGVKNRGCSGLAYHLEYVDKPGAFDETVEQDGVKVLIDSKALFSIIGSEMDWIEDKLNERFIFRNPNITEQCGCGESFSIS